MIYTLDTCAVLAIIRNENEAGKVISLIDDNSNRCYIHSINVCEIFYQCSREYGEDIAFKVIQNLFKTGVVMREDLDYSFIIEVGRLKAKMKRISIADCCGLCLSKRLNGVFVTSDHHELDPLVSSSQFNISFFR